MTPLAQSLALSPEVYPHTLDAVNDAVYCVRLTEADYARASFLDQRALAPGVKGDWVRWPDLASAADEAELARGLRLHLPHRPRRLDPAVAPDRRAPGRAVAARAPAVARAGAIAARAGLARERLERGGVRGPARRLPEAVVAPLPARPAGGGQGDQLLQRAGRADPVAAQRAPRRADGRDSRRPISPPSSPARTTTSTSAAWRPTACAGWTSGSAAPPGGLPSCPTASRWR